MTKSKISIAKNLKDTEKIAKEFLELIGSKVSKGAKVIGLSGELGAGKTHFVQAIGKHLKIKKKMNSPTFVIMKRYSLGKKGGVFEDLFHLDAYRLKNHKEILSLGWAEMIKNPKNIIFIEWPENVKKAMPRRHHKVHIAPLPAGKSGTKAGHRKFKLN